MLRNAIFPGLLAFTFAIPSISHGMCLTLAEDFQIAKILLEAMGIREGFNTDFRVERKSTNNWQDTANFKSFFMGGVRYLEGERAPYIRDKNNEGMTNVTTTIYPFARELQSLLQARIRIRQYGERPEGSSGLAMATGNSEIISLEIKAKTHLEGVVVKPIIKIRSGMLKDLFTNQATIGQAKSRLVEELITLNPETKPEVIKTILDIVETFHQTNEQIYGRNTVDAISIEYERQAYVTEVKDVQTGKKYKIQTTFDRAVSMRGSVDPTLTPLVNSTLPITYRYPNETRDALMVTEMKTPVELSDLLRDNPEYVQQNLPSFFRINGYYQMLQRNQALGFNADSGKAKQILNQGLKVADDPMALILEM